MNYYFFKVHVKDGGIIYATSVIAPSEEAVREIVERMFGSDLEVRIKVKLTAESTRAYQDLCNKKLNYN